MNLILAPNGNSIPIEGTDDDGNSQGSNSASSGGHISSTKRPPVEFTPLVRESFAGLREGQPVGSSEKQLKADFKRKHGKTGSIPPLL
eukprot:CAMPEP_0171789358 /NCGR_PEP_ID=MMETSP0991-20121206/65057_1 /TAXON_ID=483369 /ORGANISM="non described non described, Strain CCMP2098" /LENGTH=87 /DNA_ID=CAMNT_0012398703 /DNA_START=1 /DNA_END=261 /DNA_ORIENTATION=-